MDLNDIPCGGYSVVKNTVLFSLYGTTVEAVAELDGQKLSLTISDSDVMIFDGYEIVSIEKNSDAVRVRFSKTLDEATAKPIGALEENYQTLHTLVNQNQATTSTDISSVMTAISEEGYETWKEYDGVSGAYSKDQIVIDPTDSQLYKSKIDNNVWGPPSKQLDYWKLYSENE